jgi:aminopeptidase N
VKWQHEHSKHLVDTHLLRVGENSKNTFFPTTEILPTYLYCFAAGDYATIPYKDSTWDGPSLSLHCVPTSLPYLDNISSFIFDVTTKSMKFYEKFFGHDYPFNKYDQIWIRECGFTAMENAGIVTYNEARALPKG